MQQWFYNMTEQLQKITPSTDFIAGQMILIDKPLRWTSFDVVNKLRYKIRDYHQVKKVKVGHAGTLDPLATGLLIICTGRFTKKLESFQAQNKEYTGTIELGRETPSYDLETETSKTHDISSISEDQIHAAAQSLTGNQKQYPPVFSAKKIKGKRAYSYARKQEDVMMEPNDVFIESFEITGIDWPYIHFRVACSKGVYIRSLAHDFGKVLNNGACLTTLRRTRIGDFSVEDAFNIDELVNLLHEARNNV